MQVLQGIDIVSVSRIRDLIERQGRAFLDRVFTSAEKKYCLGRRMKYEHFAARFAAKEAATKALPWKVPPAFILRDIEVSKHASGKPLLRLSPRARRLLKLPKAAVFELSLTHEREYAAASVLLILP